MAAARSRITEILLRSSCLTESAPRPKPPAAATATPCSTAAVSAHMPPDERLEMETSPAEFVGCVQMLPLGCCVGSRSRTRAVRCCPPRSVSQGIDDRHVEGQSELPMRPCAIREPGEEAAWAAHQHVSRPTAPLKHKQPSQ